ncbi:MAG: calcium/sodium antiporter [Chloroflexi bacterium]|nr:calcium/sodium antiporter [Chloroflexota bacterium]
MLIALLQVVVGTTILVGGAYALVTGASNIAKALGISELVIGLTIVAIGTSAPELAITVVSALDNKPELIIGNVVGSNIANIGLILGFSAVVASINVPRAILYREFAWLLGATALIGVFAIGGEFTLPEGLILLVGVVVFSYMSYRVAVQQHDDAVDARMDGKEMPSLNLVRDGGLILLGGLGLAFGSNWLVTGATEIALEIGISEYVIGLTLVAVGTSLPELSTSIVASTRGEGDLVVGNIIGSNIYNLLLILATGMVITTLEIPEVVLEVQIPLMIGLTFALFPIIYSGRRVGRVEGSALLAAYIVITGIAFALNPGG